MLLLIQLYMEKAAKESKGCNKSLKNKICIVNLPVLKPQYFDFINIPTFRSLQLLLSLRVKLSVTRRKQIWQKKSSKNKRVHKCRVMSLLTFHIRSFRTPSGQSVSSAAIEIEMLMSYCVPVTDLASVAYLHAQAETQ